MNNGYYEYMIITVASIAEGREFESPFPLQTGV